MRRSPRRWIRSRSERDGPIWRAGRCAPNWSRWPRWRSCRWSAISGWRAFDDARQLQARHAEAASAVSGLADSRYRELMEGSRRLLVAACADDAVQRVLQPTATAEDTQRCDAYLSQLLTEFPSEYSAALVIDAKGGIARCWQHAHGTWDEFLGSRGLSPRSGQPARPPWARNVASRRDAADGDSDRRAGRARRRVRAACVRRPVDAQPCRAGRGRRNRQVRAGVALVDRAGGSLGGDTRATSALPVASRVAAAIARGRAAFARLRPERMRPTIFTFAPWAAKRSTSSAPFRRIAASWRSCSTGASSCSSFWRSLVVMTVIWLGADRWCVRPLRYIQDFAGRVARGETSSSRRRSPGRRKWRRWARASARWPRRSPAARPS